MGRPSKLTPAQWEAAKRRWEGSDKLGFEWLRKECTEAFGDAPSRPAMQQMAAEQGWEKGGEPSTPLKPSGDRKPPAKVTESPAKVTRSEVAKVTRPEVAEEVVDDAPPASSEPRGPGRPTSYRPEFAEKIIAFFDVEPFEDIPVPQPSGLVKLQRMPRKPPMLGAFAKSIGVSKTAVDTWATAVDSDGRPRHPEFAEAYARARAMQEELLTVGGAMGAYEARFLTMIMKNLCGWQDQPEPKEDHTSVSREELDRLFGVKMEQARVRQMAVLEERRQLRRLADEAAGVAPLPLATE